MTRDERVSMKCSHLFLSLLPAVSHWLCIISRGYEYLYHDRMYPVRVKP